MSRPLILLATLVTLVAPPGQAQASRAEARTAARLESLRHNTPSLYAFLRQMPKGGDLHSHLGGAVYAESFLRWAAEDSGCVATRSPGVLAPPCSPDSTTVRATSALRNQDLLNAVIDATSMRNWPPARGPGHDHFFETFSHLGATPRRTGDMVAEVMARAADGNVAYLELMNTFEAGSVLGLAAGARYRDDWTSLRDTMFTLGLERVVQQARADIDQIESRRDSVLHCGSSSAQPGCAVTVRWIYQVLRAMTPAQVFAQMLLGFRLAEVDPRVVSINLVQPEDWRVPMADYSLHMRMIQWLRQRYPKTKLTLHAGELAAGLVPPEGLRFHIREAIDVAGAQRIGHGVSVMYENHADSLLADLARRQVMVEINLTSNDGILGIRGEDHPLKAYLAAGVPVALSTDDEGVNRSEMTQEYLRAVRDQDVTYPVLKRMARTSLQFAFVEGASLWQDFARLKPVAACSGLLGGMQSARCTAFVAANSRARLQWQQERDFVAFEARMAAAR
ncbi:MAG: adenosine deaminase [Gemmatimonadales bacterium]